MTAYLVRWEIDLEADNPQQAAEKAREYQAKPDTTATVFDVFERYQGSDHPSDCQHVALIDLSEPDETVYYDRTGEIIQCRDCGDVFNPTKVDVINHAGQWLCGCGTWNEGTGIAQGALCSSEESAE